MLQTYIEKGGVRNFGRGRELPPVISNLTNGLVWTGVLPRVHTLISTGNTYIPDSDSTDLAILLVTSSSTIQVPTGSPTDGQRIVLRITSASSYPITWNPQYVSTGALLPTTSQAGKTISMGFTYDLSKDQWALLALDSVGY